MKTGRIVSLVCFSFFCFLSAPMAMEAGYPTRSIEIVVGMAPGGGADLGTRMLAENSKKDLGQEVVVVNKPGAMYKIAYTLVSKAKPDGYTLGGGSDPSITLGPHQEKMPYGPEDFTYVSQFGTLTQGFVVQPDSPFKNVKDVVEFARANPDKLTVATLGTGGFSHMTIEALAVLENLKVRLVPFAGAAPAATALLGGHVMMTSTSFTGFAPFLKAKKLRLLAVASEKRRENYPDAPTLRELGYTSLVFDSYHIIIGPKNMEKAMVTKLADAFKKAMESPNFIKINQDLEMWERNPLFGDDLKELIFRRYKQNGEIVKKLGLTIKH